ncbi:MAG: Sec-independent protein translocase protein TatB [Woeseia sp.]
MSGIGFGELIILLFIGLIVLGPERLPRVANQIGGWLGQARRMTRVMKRQLEDELNIEKHFDIVPPARTKHASLGFNPPPAAPGLAVPADAESVEKDDTYSPAHDAEGPGTGVDEAPAAPQSEPAAADDANKKEPK